MTSTHLVTGATSGIGREVAGLLHARGDRVVLLARTEERRQELLTAFPGADVLVADLAEPQLLEERLVARLPEALDSLLHVAGVVEVGRVAEQSLADLQVQFTVNLTAPAELTRVALPALRRARGTVVFVNSTSGLTANPGWAAYAASKFGLRGFADALRAEEAPHGVRVTSAFPSRTATPMQAKVHAQEGKPYDPQAWMRATTVAQQVVNVIDLPRDATVTDLTMRTAPRATSG